MTRAELAAAGFALDAPAYDRLARYVELLLAANQRLNLTGTRDPAAFWRRHVCDSLTLAGLVRAAGARTLLDIGTGGGLPGVPVAISLPEIRVTLLDGTRKKVAALAGICDALGLSNVRVCWGRAENLALDDPRCARAFDGATARAVAALPKLLSMSAHLVRPGGRAWFFKSTQAAAGEVAAAARVARVSGWTIEPAHEYELPGGEGRRVLLVCCKSRGGASATRSRERGAFP